MNKFIVSLSLLLCVGVFQSSFGQNRTDVRIENDVFSVSYNETLEQPNWVEYEVRDIVKIVEVVWISMYQRSLHQIVMIIK